MAQPLMVAGFLSKALTLSSVETILSQSTRNGSLSHASTLHTRFMTSSEMLATFCRANEFEAAECHYQSCGILRVLDAAALRLVAPALYVRGERGLPAQKDFSLFSAISSHSPQLSRAATGEAKLNLDAFVNFSAVPQRTFFTSLWGSWLSMKTSIRGAASLAAELSGSSLFHLSSLFLFNQGYTGVSRKSIVNTLISVSHYLRKHIFALNSFSVAKTFSVRAILFSTLTGFYLKTFFFRNFVLKRPATTFVNRTLSAIAVRELRASLPFTSAIRLTNSFTKAFLSGSAREPYLIMLGGSKVRAAALFLKRELPLQPLL